MFQTLKAIENVGNLPTDNLNGTLGALALTGLIQGLELAGIKIPPKILEMAQVGVQALSQPMTDAAMEVAQEALANLVVDLGKELGVDIAKTAVTEALADVGTAITVIGIVYKAVMFGFSIADIAQRDDLSDEMKASLATHALAVEVMKVGISSGNWVVIVVAAVINAVSAFIDMAENGLTRYNIGQLLLGDLGAFLLPEREPNAWQGTFSPADDSTHPNDLFALNRFGADKDGVIHHTGGGNDGMGNRDAFIRVTTPFGITEFSMHEMPRGMDANDPKYFSSIDQLKPLLLQIRDTDELVAKAINEADIRNGEAGRSMAHYNATLPGNRFAEKQDLDGLDATAMGDNRYATIADRLGASGSKAGIAYNAWADMLTSKVIDGSGVDIALATSIGKNPSLLDIPPDVIRRIGNTIAPGSLGVVLGQANTTITHFSTARYNPLVQQMMPMDDMQAMDWVIKTYGLNEGNQWIAVPTPAKRPGLSDTVTALSAVPAEGKALVASLNRSGVADHGGKIEILGMTAWNPDYYGLRIDGVQNAYAFMGDHFLQISNVDLRPAIAPEVWLMSHDLPAGPATPQAVFGVVQTLGDMQWVDTNAAIDPQVETLAKIMAQQNPQFQFLGATKNWPDHYEIFVPGRGQHAYTLQDVDGQLVFMQDSQTTLAARQAVSAA